MSVRLGISPIGWSNDDLPELGGDIPVDICLAKAREAGFEGIELGHKFPRDPALLRPLLAYHGLRLISGWYSGRLLEQSVAEELEAVERHRPGGGDGLHGSGLFRNHWWHRRRPNRAAIEPTEATRWRMEGFRCPTHGAGRPFSGTGYPPHLSPPQSLAGSVARDGSAVDLTRLSAEGAGLALTGTGQLTGGGQTLRRQNQNLRRHRATRM
jgi:hypothetical protein